ncbi:MAG: succinyl-diaminopimelate desuccinylase [Gammaproteobacteria bacterium]|nr:succinyl-diaminopimelate desuccinylase [Gammaproteobacteria bacterium]
MSEVLELSCELIRRESITPEDDGCQDLIAKRLVALGFNVESFPAGGVSNLWATHGNTEPLLVFAGHTDVVPVGSLDRWTNPPFEPTVDGKLLYGRGACDMKSGVASMVVAIERFVQQNPQHRGSLGVLFTSDEEGIATHGTKQVMQVLKQRKIDIDWCVVGEPSSSKTLGDTIRVGRRGSLTGTLSAKGTIGHVAYPELTPNVVHELVAPLEILAKKDWDQGNEHFQPTTFQISNIHAGTGADNVIPGELEVQFNFRFNTEHSPESLQRTVDEALNAVNPKIHTEITWWQSGLPFLSKQGILTQTTIDVLQDVTGCAPVQSTGGGTSDARFIVPTGTETVELGHLNVTAHKYDEHVLVEDLEVLAQVYERIIGRLLR